MAGRDGTEQEGTLRQPPNVVVVVADDLGYGDLSCLGSGDIATPNIDSIAADGALLTSWYSNSPVCSPSRASLLTGRYPYRTGVRSILQGFRTTPGLSPRVPTMASLLLEAGYRTEHVGKWHLGLTSECRPRAHGFQRTFGHLAGSVDYFSHIHYSTANRSITLPDGSPHRGAPLHDLWEQEQEVHHDGEYLTELIGRRAADAAARLQGGDSPFFLYVAFNAPHFPLHAPERYKDPYRHLPPDRMIMAAMVSALDEAVGSLLEALRRDPASAEQTLVLFMSDNGPSREIQNWSDGTQRPFRGSSSGPLKGHKFSLFEGGIRVPGLISWPGVVPPGQQIDEPMMAMDLLPTLLGAAGIDTEPLDLDGRDVRPVLGRGASSDDRYLFWEQRGQTAVRHGDWKLVLDGQLAEDDPVQEPVFLSDVRRDPGETTNQATAEPALTADLTARARDWRAAVERHQLPDHPPTRPRTATSPTGVSPATVPDRGRDRP